MLTLMKRAGDPAFPSTSSLFFEAEANVFFLKDRMGGQPTTCALKLNKDHRLNILYNQIHITHFLLLEGNTHLVAGAPLPARFEASFTAEGLSGTVLLVFASFIFGGCTHEVSFVSPAFTPAFDRNFPCRIDLVTSVTAIL